MALHNVSLSSWLSHWLNDTCIMTNIQTLPSMLKLVKENESRHNCGTEAPICMLPKQHECSTHEVPQAKMTMQQAPSATGMSAQALPVHTPYIGKADEISCVVLVDVERLVTPWQRRCCRRRSRSVCQPARYGTWKGLRLHKHTFVSTTAYIQGCCSRKYLPSCPVIKGALIPVSLLGMRMHITDLCSQCLQARI